MRTLFYLEPSAARGGIEIFAERHAAALRAAGREVEIAHEVPADFAPFDEIVVHKCTDLATLERFPPERTVLYVHDHDPICPRSRPRSRLRRRCERTRASAGRQARQSGAQRRHGQIPDARVQLRRSGV